MAWTLIDVAKRDLGSLVLGQPVAVRARGYSGRIFDGRIRVIYPQINRETRTIRVRIELTNADTALLPEMYVDAEVNIGAKQPVPAAPESAVIDSGSRQVVFVDKGEGRFEPRQVKLGARGGYVEIREGVTTGKAIDQSNMIPREPDWNAARRPCRVREMGVGDGERCVGGREVLSKQIDTTNRPRVLLISLADFSRPNSILN